MLVIERTIGSAIRIGSDIRIKVTEIPGSRRVRLGLEVPMGTLIWREEAPRADTKAARSALPPKASLNVLVIEDDASHAHLIEKGFNRAGSSKTHWVDSAEEALKVLQKERDSASLPNLLMIDMDLGLGQMDGIELIEELSKDSVLGQLPIVMLSAVAQAEDINAAFAAGASAFIAKTDDYTEFSNLIIRVAEFWRLNVTPHPQLIANGQATRRRIKTDDS